MFTQKNVSLAALALASLVVVLVIWALKLRSSKTSVPLPKEWS